MEDKFKEIYAILKALEAAMDCPEFSISQIDHDKLGITYERWAQYLEMMKDEGLIKGVKFFKDISGNTIADAIDIRITLQGIEYLNGNPIMQNISNAAKGIKNIT